MTTVPGHNQLIQHAGFAQEVSHQASQPKPGPDQAIAVQEARESIQNSSVQGGEESERLKQEREKLRQAKREQLLKKRKKASETHEADAAPDPDSPGQLLDTTV